MEYLIGLIKELQSNRYLTELMYPIINNLYKYPIKCKDTFVSAGLTFIFNWGKEKHNDFELDRQRA